MMRKFTKIVLCGAAFALCCGTASAEDALSKLFSGSGLGGVLGNVVQETIAQNKPLEVADLEGTWVTTGPAVVLKSGNVLEQAGGAAVAGMAEDQIRPYYDKLGLDNTVMTFDAQGNFTITIKRIPVKGKLVKAEDGSFSLQLLSGVGKLKKDACSMTAYVQKAGNETSLTADVKKLLGILETVAGKTDLKTIKTAVDMLGKYEHVCLGFRLRK